MKTITDLINHARRLSLQGTRPDIFALAVVMAQARTYRDCEFTFRNIIEEMERQTPGNDE